MSYMPPRLAEIVEDFGFVEGTEKLEYLLEFSESLPPLPDWLLEKRGDMQPIHECMTPVFVHGELNQDGTMHYYFDAPAQSPTVRGFASIMMEGVNDAARPEQVLEIPELFYQATGLPRVLSGQRMHGMSVFLGYMKRIAQQFV